VRRFCFEGINILMTTQKQLLLALTMGLSWMLTDVRAVLAATEQTTTPQSASRTPTRLLRNSQSGTIRKVTLRASWLMKEPSTPWQPI
jgi:hypothetical protein